jgi:hypothetical protein
MAHMARQTMNILRKMFPHYLARSYVTTPAFFPWGYLKIIAFESGLLTTEELKN